jgi:hypothetical protein
MGWASGTTVRSLQSGADFAFEPVSAHCRTGLRVTETEIGKTRAETQADPLRGMPFLHIGETIIR